VPGAAPATGSTTGTTPGATNGQGAPTAGVGAPGGTGRVGPGGTRMAPGPSGSDVTTQRSGPGGTTLAPGPGGNTGGGIQGTTGTADATLGGSGSPTPTRPDCVPRAGGSGFGALPRIMADEPGRRGQSSGSDARAGTTGSAGTSAIPPAPGC
jgi:hypothetical protein